MTVLSAQTIRRLKLIEPCLDAYHDPIGNSAGLGPCGYDLTLADDVWLYPEVFKLTFTVERFNLPNDIVAIIHDKSTLARLGLAVQNTVAEPGWHGWLTLEVNNHGTETIHLPAGCAIAQVIFHQLDEPTDRPYCGRYQDQRHIAQGPILNHKV